jgi:hypothetical protein
VVGHGARVSLNVETYVMRKTGRGGSVETKNTEKALAGVHCESEYIRGVSLIQRLEAKPHRPGLERPAG